MQIHMMNPLETVALARSDVPDAVQVHQVTDEEDARQVDYVAQEAQDAEVGSAMLQQADMDDESAFERDIAPLRERADVAAIVHGMNKHAGHHGIQDKGLEALLALTPSVEGEAWQAIRDEGGDQWTSMEQRYRALASAGVVEVVCRGMSRDRQLLRAAASFS